MDSETKRIVDQIQDEIKDAVRDSFFRRGIDPHTMASVQAMVVAMVQDRIPYTCEVRLVNLRVEGTDTIVWDGFEITRVDADDG